MVDKKKERSRAIVQYNEEDGIPATGSLKELQACNTDVTSCAEEQPLNCLMGDWSEWTACSRNCGGGQRYHLCL